MSLRPICLDCGSPLAANIGTRNVVCVLCENEYELIQIDRRLTHTRKFGGDEISYENKENWK